MGNLATESRDLLIVRIYFVFIYFNVWSLCLFCINYQDTMFFCTHLLYQSFIDSYNF